MLCQCPGPRSVRALTLLAHRRTIRPPFAVVRCLHANARVMQGWKAAIERQRPGLLTRYPIHVEWPEGR